MPRSETTLHPEPIHTEPTHAEPTHGEPSHDWLRLLGDPQGPELERSLRRLARLAAAAHRAESAPAVAHATAPIPIPAPAAAHASAAATPPNAKGGLLRKLHGKLRPHRREDDSRDHGRSPAAVDPRPRGGSVAKECHR